jgi:hypothetical protein
LTKAIGVDNSIAEIYGASMSVPPDQLMQMMRQQRAPEQPSPMASEASATDQTMPMASPMSTPEPKMGNREGALVNLGLAMDLIEQSLPALGTGSPEATKVMTALRTLSGVVGGKRESVNELKQSEILQMLQTLPQAGGATPEGKALAAAPAIPGMQMPGATPKPM